MSVEEQVRVAIDMLDAEAPDLGRVVAEGRRRRRRARALAGVGGAVAAVVIAALVAGAVGGPADDRAVPPSSTPSSSPQVEARRQPPAELIPEARRGASVELAGTTTDGTEIDVADLRGEIVVVRFWGSWCAPCLADAAIVDAIADEHDVEVLGVAFEEASPADLEAAEDALGLTFSSIYDPTGEVVRGLGVRAAPMTYVLDPEGRIAAIATGQLDRSTLDLVLLSLRAAAVGDGIPPTLLDIRNETPGPIWITFSDGSTAQIDPGRSMALGSERVCELMPLTATAPDGTTLATYDEPCAGQTWTIGPRR